jgi:aspartyl-tRNA(Asn)/glutamyl-tRNA(Gln) amidotransferase subunit A
MYLSSRGAAFGTLLKSYLFQGAFFQFQRYEAYEDACRVRARLREEMQQITAQADFLVLPATNGASSGTDVNLENFCAQFASTAFANVTGQPVLYLPPTPGTAAGLQIAGPRISDGRLLALGEHLLNINRGGK